MPDSGPASGYNTYNYPTCDTTSIHSQGRSSYMPMPSLVPPQALTFQHSNENGSSSPTSAFGLQHQCEQQRHAMGAMRTYGVSGLAQGHRLGLPPGARYGESVMGSAGSQARSVSGYGPGGPPTSMGTRSEMGALSDVQTSLSGDGEEGGRGTSLVSYIFSTPYIFHTTATILTIRDQVDPAPHSSPVPSRPKSQTTTTPT